MWEEDEGRVIWVGRGRARVGSECGWEGGREVNTWAVALPPAASVTAAVDEEGEDGVALSSVAAAERRRG
jgi:hypothetical protein